MNVSKILVCSAFAVVLFSVAPVSAQQAPSSVSLKIKDHHFVPMDVKVPANKPLTITILNEDGSAEEFESETLKIEKVVPGGATATVQVRPLKPGRYPFVGEFHKDTAKGVLIAE